MFFFSCTQAGIKAGLSDSEVKEVLAMSTTKEIKDRLKSTTQKALDYGVSCFSALLVNSVKRHETIIKLMSNE